MSLELKVALAMDFHAMLLDTIKDWRRYDDNGGTEHCIPGSALRLQAQFLEWLRNA